MRKHLLSVGHSNHSIEHFVSLLRKHSIEAVADVRSSPRSAFAAQFNREALARTLKQMNVAYVFLGHELGGRPSDDQLYDDEGHVLYGEVARTAAFRQGIERLEAGATEMRIAMMCSEEDPADCHRRLLVSRVLSADGFDVTHIRGDGRLETESIFEARTDLQQSLFGQEEALWRSTRSVLHRRLRATSSAD